MRIYVKFKDPDLELIKSFKEKGCDKMQKEAMIAMLALNNQGVLEELAKYFNSDKVSDRLLAIDIASVGCPKYFSTQIEMLCKDVRDHAIKAACSLKLSSVVPLAVELMKCSSFRKDMSEGLSYFGEDLIPLVDKVLLDKYSLFSQFRLIIRVLSGMKNQHVDQYLFEKSFELSSRRKDFILRCLLKNNYIVPNKDGNKINNAISETLKLLHQFINNNDVLGGYDHVSQIRKGLDETVDFFIKRLLMYTAFKYETIDNDFLMNNFYSKDANLKSLSIEYLEYQLSRDENTQLLPMFINQTHQANIKAYLNSFYGEIKCHLEECLHMILDARMSVSL